MSTPDPATTDWVPLWNLSEAAGALPADTVIASATRIISNKFAAPDTQPAWRVLGSGKMEFGPGGSSAVDTNLYRHVTLAGTLKTDGRFQLGGVDPVTTSRLSVVGEGPLNSIEFGHSNAAGYRSTIGANVSSGAPWIAFHAEAGTNVNSFKTRGIPGSVFGSDLAGGWSFRNIPTASADNQLGTEVFRIRNDGLLYIGAGADTTLYRFGAGILKTDGSCIFQTGLYAGNYVSSWPLYIMSDGKLNWSNDTNLYRLQTGVLKTDGTIQANIFTAYGGYVYLGPVATPTDTNLYRNSPGQVKTDGAFWAAGNLISNSGVYADYGNTQARLWFGSGGDTSLYRHQANMLRTPGNFYGDAVGWVMGGTSVGRQFRWGNATVGTDSGGIATIYYDATFPTATVMVNASSGSYANGGALMFALWNWAASWVQFRVYNQDGTLYTNGTVTICYFAIGY
jgi:hypothetical protein